MTKQQDNNQQHNENTENQQPYYFQNQYNTDPSQFIPLWEQMGASTGGMIGRFIGLNFYAGVVYLTNFLSANPMQNPYTSQQNPTQHAAQSNNMAATQNFGAQHNSPRGYFVTIQTDTDNVETVQGIITNNHGQV